jgi:FixJ family two-component response regulator
MATHSPRIAIVDDDAAVRKALTRLLKAANYHPDAYPSVEEFLAALGDEVPECLLVDYQLPRMTGLDLQAHLRENGVSIPVIIITAHNETKVRESCILLGASAFLAKPVGRRELLAAIQYALKSQASACALE